MKTSKLLLFSVILLGIWSCKTETDKPEEEKAKPKAPSAFALLAPENEAVINDLKPTLNWAEGEESSDLNYDVYLGKSEKLAEGDRKSTAQTSTSYQVEEDLEGNAKYYWQIEAKNSNKLGTKSKVFSFSTIDITPNLTAPGDKSYLSNLTPTFTWKSEGTDLKYDVYFAKSEQFVDADRKKIDQTESSYTVATNLEMGSTYYWKIVAKKGDFETESDTYSFTTYSLAPISYIPTNEATGVGFSPTLSWNPNPYIPAEATVTYELYFGTSNELSDTDKKTSQSETTYEISEELPMNTIYYWKVVAINENNTKVESDVFSFTTADITPQLKTPQDGATKVRFRPQFTWQQTSALSNSENLTYDLYYGSAEELKDADKKKSDLTEPSFTVLTDLDKGATYYWKVVSKFDDSEIESGVYSFTVGSIKPSVKAPANDAKNVGFLPQLSWEVPTKPDNQTLSYEVYFGGSSTLTVSDQKATGQTETTYTVKNVLTEETKYYWKVVAKNQAGTASAESDVFSFTTGKIEALQLTKPQNGATGQGFTPTFEWNPAQTGTGEAIFYEFHFGNSNSTLEKINTTDITSTQYVLPNGKAQPNTTHYWKVVGRTQSGATSESAVYSFTTIDIKPTLSTPNNQLENQPFKLSFTWKKNATAPSSVKYHVYLDAETTAGESVEPTTKLNTDPIDGLTYEADLQQGTKYYWLVEAVIGGSKSKSETFEFTTIGIKPTVTAPENGITDAGFLPEFSWEAPAAKPDDETLVYDVYIGESSEFEESDRIAENLTELTHTAVNILKQGTLYYWKVVAKNQRNTTSADSEVRSFTTKKIKATPLTPTNKANKQSIKPTLTWERENTTHTGVTYHIYLDAGTTDGNPVEPTTKLNTDPITGSTYTIPDGKKLEQDKTYYWAVELVQGGVSSKSETFEFTTIGIRPALDFPTKDATDVGFKPEFKWEVSVTPDQGTLEYDIYVGLSSDFQTRDKIVTDHTQNSFQATTALDQGTLYYWKVVAKNKTANTSVESLVQSFTTAVIKELKLLEPKSGALSVDFTPTFTWEKAELGADGEEVFYEVHFGAGSGSNVKKINTEDITGTQYILPDGNTNPNSDYYWKVVAKTRSGAEKESSLFYFTTAKIKPTPTAPEKNAKKQSLKPTLTWTKDATGPQDVTFNIYMDRESDKGHPVDYPKTKLNTDPIEGTTYTLTDEQKLELGKDYYWVVEAVKGGASSKSATFNFETISTKPILNYPKNKAEKVELHPELQWEKSGSAPDDGKYHIYISEDNTTFTKINDEPQTATTLVMNQEKAGMNLKVNQTYYWKVEAIYTDGEDEITTETDAFQFKTGRIKPTIVSPEEDTSNTGFTLEFKWKENTQKPEKEALTYNIYLGTEEDEAKLEKANTGETLITGTTFTLTKLKSATEYYWQVEAETSGGVKDRSNMLYFNTADLTPIITKPTNNSPNQSITLFLSWKRHEGLPDTETVTYDIYLDEKPEPTTLIKSGLENIYNYTLTEAQKLENNKKYYWYVEAKNADGVLATSKTVNFTTGKIAPTKITYPEDKSISIPIKPKLTWEKAENAPDDEKYTVYISTDPSIPRSDETNLARNISATEFQITDDHALEIETTYYWEISNTAEDGNSEATGSFTTGIETDDSFVATFKIEKSNTLTDLDLTLPLKSPSGTSVVHDFKIDWGDGTPIAQYTGTGSESLKHTYANETKEYKVVILGEVGIFNYSESGDKLKIREIKQWGTKLKLGPGDSHFKECTRFNIAENAGVPDLSTTTSFKSLFEDATSFNADISEWDTKEITTMQSMFSGATSFNKPVNFYTHKVNNMKAVFSGAIAFNQSITKWRTTEVTDMSYMFYNAKAFNSELKYWEASAFPHKKSGYATQNRFDTRNVTDMTRMFAGATSYNKRPNFVFCGITEANNLFEMFNGATSFNKNLSKNKDHKDDKYDNEEYAWYFPNINRELSDDEIRGQFFVSTSIPYDDRTKKKPVFKKDRRRRNDDDRNYGPRCPEN